MKLFGVVVALFVLVSEAAAEQALQLEAKIMQLQADGTSSTLAVPRVVVESGKLATIEVGALRCDLTAKLVAPGQVEIEMKLAEVDGKNTRLLMAPRLVTRLNQSAEIQVDKLAVKVTPSLVK